MRRGNRCAAFALVTLLCAASVGEAQRIFDETFEGVNDYQLFEENVGCAASGLAGTPLRSTAFAHSGTASGLVFANAAAVAGRRNHVNWYKRIFPLGQNGRWRYAAYAYIPAGGSGQTGPELSVQNTRQPSPGVYRTSTAAVQYVANASELGSPYLQIWRQTSPGNAAWIPFEPPVMVVVPTGTWIKFTLDVDYDVDQYVALSIRTVDGTLNLSLPVAGVSIAAENKGFDSEAFVATIEAQNLDACNAGAVHQYRVAYDDVSLQALAPSSFTDDPLVAGVTTIRAVHVSELRARTDVQRARCNRDAFAWSGGLAAGQPVTAAHVQDLRDALSGAYAGCAMVPPAFGSPLTAGMPITAAQLTAIRNALVFLE